MSHRQSPEQNTTLRPLNIFEWAVCDLPVLLSFAPVCDVVSPCRRTRRTASSPSRVRRGGAGPRPSAGPSCASYRWL